MLEKTLIQSNTLPELPKILKKGEAKVSTQVLSWFKKNHPSSCALEIKNTTKNTIPKSAVLPHQLLALKDSKSSNGLIHKLSDESRRQQPYDAFMLKNADAYVVACFSKYGYCLMIPVDEWNGAKYTNSYPHISLTITNQ